MGIAPISGFGYTPYVYNTNIVSKASLGSVNKIPDDVLSSKVGYESSEQENINPLKMGETKNLGDVIMSQMSMGYLNAARVLKSPEEMLGE